MAESELRWITPLYSFETECDHIGVPDGARRQLERMASDVLGTGALVAIYIPQGTEEMYSPGNARGRVVGAVRLVEMPTDRRMEDYFYEDWDGTRRWPIGWPCEVVSAPDHAECPSLRDHVEQEFGSGSFAGYVGRFQHGPFELDPKIRDRLNRDFARFELTR